MVGQARRNLFSVCTPTEFCSWRSSSTTSILRCEAICNPSERSRATATRAPANVRRTMAAYTCTVTAWSSISSTSIAELDPPPVTPVPLDAPFFEISLRLETLFPNDFSVAREIGVDQRLQLLRRARLRHGALRDQFFLYVRLRHCLFHVSAYLLQDGGRRPRRREERDPRSGFRVVDAGFRHRRHVRQRGRALGVRHRQAFQLAALDMPGAFQHGREKQVDVSR